MRQEQRGAVGVEEAARCTAEDEFLQAGVAERARHQDIGVGGPGGPDKGGRGIAAVGENLRLGDDTASGQEGYEIIYLELA